MNPRDNLPPWLPAPALPPAAPLQPLRFAFYGRVSTEDNQDPEASRLWQLERAKALITPLGGRIVAEYFDVGHSRALPWKRRPRATALLTALTDADRGFDAVVIGEPQRAFYGNQFGNTFPLFAHWRVPLWVPEVGGAIDPDNEAHDLITSVFGGMSKGERNRIRIRVRAAMASQALMEGRFLGGRPPYGYHLADAGPHPHPGKAAEGKRLHRLATDQDTAPIVQRIFREYLAGHSLFAVAEGLTRDGIPSPAAADPRRNRHRDGRAWAKSAVRTILLNPRYTGRQVWNRQRKEESLLHRRAEHGGEHKTHRTRNPYLFRGLITCAACDRRMQAQWSHGDAYYRCRFPNDYALANRITHPRNVYLRESWLIRPLDTWLAKVFAPHRLDDTIDQLAATDPASTAAASDAAAHTARAAIAACDTKIAAHRAALEAGADPALVARWLAETQAQRARAEAELRATTGGAAPARMSRDEIARLVSARRSHLGDPQRSRAGQGGDLPATRSPSDLPARAGHGARRSGTGHLRRSGHTKNPTGRFPWGNGWCPRGDGLWEPTELRGLVDGAGVGAVTPSLGFLCAAGFPPCSWRLPSILVQCGGYHYLYVSFDYCCRGAQSTYRIVAGRSASVTGLTPTATAPP